MESLLDLEIITGRMEAILKEIFWTVWEKERDFGKRELDSQINTKVVTEAIRNGAMANLPGFQEIYIKEIMRLIREMATAKFTGQTELLTKDNGSTVSSMV